MFLLQGRSRKLIYPTLLLAASCAQAEKIQDDESSTFFSNVEISAAGGVNWYNVPDTHLVISSSERDSNKVKQTSVEGAWKVGIGYYLFEEKLEAQRYFNQLLVELNLYQTYTTLKGDTWEFEGPQFYNYNFEAPVTSTRLMLDFKPNFFNWKGISAYAILGVGATWNEVSYHEKANAADIVPQSRLKLSDKTTTHVAWDVGAGFNIALTDHLSATAEYIYAFLGEGSPAHDPINGVALEKPPVFSLETQSLLFGLLLKF